MYRFFLVVSTRKSSVCVAMTHCQLEQIHENITNPASHNHLPHKHSAGKPSSRKDMSSAGRNRFFITTTTSKGIISETGPTEQVTSFDSLHGGICTLHWWLDFSGWIAHDRTCNPHTHFAFVHTLEVWKQTQHIPSRTTIPRMARQGPDSRYFFYVSWKNGCAHICEGLKRFRWI